MNKCLHSNDIQRSECWAEIFSPAQHEGFRSLQIELPPDRVPAEWITELLEQNLPDLASQHALDIAALTTRQYDLFSLASADEKHRRECRENHQALISEASRFGSDMMVTLCAHTIHPAGKPLDTSYEKAFNHLFGELEEVAHTADNAGVYLAFENPAAGLLLSPLELRGFLDQINSPYLRVCLNPFHARILAPVNDWIEILNHRITALSWPQTQDENPTRPLKLDDIISRLAEYDFHGPVIFS
jgi:hexulose-6-phosphate isomerase